MKIANLTIAVMEAERFIQIAKRVKIDNYGFIIDGGKVTGAVKRASMDLTRALSELRKA